jgi:hypothetical protein
VDWSKACIKTHDITATANSYTTLTAIKAGINRTNVIIQAEACLTAVNWDLMTFNVFCSLRRKDKNYDAI